MHALHASKMLNMSDADSMLSFVMSLPCSILMRAAKSERVMEGRTKPNRQTLSSTQCLQRVRLLR